MISAARTVPEKSKCKFTHWATPQGIVADIRRLAILVEPDDVPAVIAADPDDDHVLACAVVVGAELVVSGDSHLLGLGSYQRIRIVAPAEAVAILWRD